MQNQRNSENKGEVLHQKKRVVALEEKHKCLT